MSIGTEWHTNIMMLRSPCLSGLVHVQTESGVRVSVTIASPIASIVRLLVPEVTYKREL